MDACNCMGDLIQRIMKMEWQKWKKHFRFFFIRIVSGWVSFSRYITPYSSRTFQTTFDLYNYIFEFKFIHINRAARYGPYINGKSSVTHQMINVIFEYDNDDNDVDNDESLMMMILQSSNSKIKSLLFASFF